MKLKSSSSSGRVLAFLSTALLLQVYHVFRTDISPGDEKIKDNNNHPWNPSHKQRRIDEATPKLLHQNIGSDHHPQSLSHLRPKNDNHRRNKDEKEEAFSACLMFMDDNAQLIEWLAYHYQTLPLRRLIIAVDPRSQTSPSKIIQRWKKKSKMDITEWTDIDFMPPTAMDAHLNVPPLNQDALTALFRRRQEEFYARCMARLKYEGQTWTALIDTDEYILLNQHYREFSDVVSKMATTTRFPSPTFRMPNLLTILKTLQQYAQDKQDVEQQLLQQEPISKVVLDNRTESSIQSPLSLPLSSTLLSSPCIPMARLSFGVKESEMNQIQNKDVPWGFTASDFQTLRWRWHAGRTKKSINKISKALVDVSRIDSSLFVPTEQVMVHLPIKEYCPSDNLWILNTHSLFVVHHYGGTWEQWSHRQDTRGKRTRQAYDKMKYDKQTDDAIRPWLREFVNTVGWWTAIGLLRDVGKV